MRNALCLLALALAFAAPAAVAAREHETRRRGEWRQPADAPPQHVAVLPVTAINGSSLVFATADGFFATGVRLARDATGALRSWTVDWPAARPVG